MIRSIIVSALIAAAISLPSRAEEQNPFDAGANEAGSARNIALLLLSLPAATIEPFLLFIGCYQVPMYLTPLLMRRVLR